MAVEAARIIPDKQYLQLAYRLRLGRKLDLKNPKRYTEKLQWLKLFDRRPIYTQMVDKFAAKRYIADRVGEEYVVPTLGVWSSFDDIDFDALPNKFILKCTHDCGSYVICRDKRSFDFGTARKRLNTALRRNHFHFGREWPYKNVVPRIIAEQLLENPDGSALSDYKLFCFSGVSKMLYVTFGRDRGGGLSFAYYDVNGNPLPLKHYKYKTCTSVFSPPSGYRLMLDLARKLSSGIPHVRVDFYAVENRVYVGELTFFTDAGFAPIDPPEYDEIMGSWITLPDHASNADAAE